MYYSEEALAYLLAVKEGYIAPIREDILKLHVEVKELRAMVALLVDHMKNEPTQ